MNDRLREGNARALQMMNEMKGTCGDTKFFATCHHELGSHVTDGHKLGDWKFPRGITISVFYRASDGLHVNWHATPQSGDARYYIATAQPAFVTELHKYLELVSTEGRPLSLTTYI